MIKSYFVLALLSMTPGLHSQAAFADWVEVRPGGETTCARGNPYSFFYRLGESDNVVIDFQGGGACWDARTCQENSFAFEDSVDDLRKEIARGGLRGLHDLEHRDNDFATWTRVIVPYCTGDLHWGDAVVRDAADAHGAMHHRGAANVRAVLEWLAASDLDPEKFLVTGCSAGSYASIYWSPHIIDMYPNADHLQFGDSGAGVMTSNFQGKILDRWHPQTNAADWIPGLDPRTIDWHNLRLSDFYNETSSYYPQLKTGQFNSRQDTVQQLFYFLMGGIPFVWELGVHNEMSRISTDSPNFAYAILEGDQHCYIVNDLFYADSIVEGGLSRWLTQRFTR